MTRGRLGAIATLSVIATAVVLADGGRTSSSDAALEAASRHALLVHAALPARAAADTGAAPARAVAPAPASHAARRSTAPASKASPPSSSSGSGSTKQTGSGDSASTQPTGAAPKASSVKHVFVIALTADRAQPAFGATSTASYLATQLKQRGTLLSGFRPLDASDLPNYIAMTGGQPPNPDTRGECATFSDFPPDAAPSNPDGVVSSPGCVYPNTVITIGDQLTASRHTWRAYAEDLGAGSDGAQTCRHPRPGEPDDTLRARSGDQYATRHNPFVYFHSLLDLGDCMANDVALDRLPTDLRSVSTTPDYAFIAPNLCDSGTESPCVDGRPGGLATADAFLHEWVPRILASPAYKRDGLLLITFLSSATTANATPTTTTPAAPTEPATASPSPTGTLVLSRFARAGRTIAKPYDPYSVLRSLEDLFGLTPLARARDAASFAKAALPGAFGA